VVGVDKDSNEEVSLLTHQDPVNFLKSKREQFDEHIRESLRELKARCEQGTIDAVIIGGEARAEHFIPNYKESIGLLTEEVRQELGFDPIVAAGPKKTRGSDAVYFDTKNRRLYLFREHPQDSSTGGFIHSNIDEVEKKGW
jgi:hypothetical protein